MAAAAKKDDAALEILNVEQAAKFLGLGLHTVYDAANRNEIPHRRVGRRILFSRTSLILWLNGDLARR